MIMENLKKIEDVDISTNEGRLLISAIAVLTSLRIKNILDKQWGAGIDYQVCIQKLSEIADGIFVKKEYRTDKISVVKQKRRIKQIQKNLK
jgi:hypothetical protein